MTYLIDALPKNADGQIDIPVAAIDNDGNVYPGVVDIAWLQIIFCDYVNLSVPLSSDQFDNLKNHLLGNWPENWQRFRDQGVI